ncbi:hypothetical protein BN946_scf184596.g2 [Trametes cinnabarina]|uniref:Uncharacterized protein n=1 Tax=Pycnoporus cinnabarinus TaxID=5643 RepID=A0A060SUP6_PYCCI|nr:hypothetical protein BN946_scf184596.g2 [Trametes cinnabarina]
MSRLSPASLQYAVVQMDPLSMLEHYADEIANAAAMTLRPKKYLVYLNSAQDLPFPTSAWFRHKVDLVGTTRRQPEPDRGITSDMAIPIDPNCDRPQNRDPILTDPPFPFDNCYHWVDCSATIRIRRREGLYDDCAAVKLSAQQHLAMSKAFCEDYNCLDAFEGHQSVVDSSDRDEWTSTRCFTPSSEDSTLLDDIGDGGEQVADNIYEFDVFNLSRDDDAEFLPLVDLWFDLENHLKADSIPSPMDFFQEQEAMRAIIQDARRRNPDVRLPPRNGDLDLDSDLSDVDEDSASDQCSDDSLCEDEVAHAERMKGGAPTSLSARFAPSEQSFARVQLVVGEVVALTPVSCSLLVSISLASSSDPLLASGQNKKASPSSGCGGCQIEISCSQERRRRARSRRKEKCAINRKYQPGGGGAEPKPRKDLRAFTSKHRPSIAVAASAALQVNTAQDYVFAIFLRPRSKGAAHIETAFWALGAAVVPITAFPPDRIAEMKGQLKSAHALNVANGALGAMEVVLMSVDPSPPVVNVVMMGFGDGPSSIEEPGPDWKHWLLRRLSDVVVC